MWKRLYTPFITKIFSLNIVFKVDNPFKNKFPNKWKVQVKTIFFIIKAIVEEDVLKHQIYYYT
jgi:hypothetical protein